MHNLGRMVLRKLNAFMCVFKSKDIDKGMYGYQDVYISVDAREFARVCLSIGMLSVSRRGLRNQLRALLWLDVSLSFVLE